MAHLSHTDHADWLRRLTSDFAATSSSISHHTPVPSCPGWTISDLVRHLGRVHAWARAAIVERRSIDVDSEPPSGASITAWYSEHARALIEAIESTPPDDPVWTFGPPPHRVTFWSRRQTNETAIHLWDAQAAVGHESDLDPGLAADGIDEVVTMFYPRQVRLGRTDPLTRSIELRSPPGSGAGRWLVGHGPPEATVTGSASDVLLLLWKRRHLDDPRLTLEGDEDAARAVLGHRLTP